VVLLPRSQLVGEKTDSTASVGVLQPGGGSCFVAIQVDTARFLVFKKVRGGEGGGNKEK